MILARSRGVRFVKVNGWMSPDVGLAPRAWAALNQVAQALGYPGPEEYNHACQERPDEVRARLAAL